MEENNIKNNPDTKEKSVSASSVKSDAEKKSVSTTTSNKTGFIAGGIVLVAILVAGYFYLNDTDQLSSLTGNEESVALEQVADDQVVAKVDGEEIMGSQLNSQTDLMMRQFGFTMTDIDAETLQQIRSQAIESLINTKLITKSAKAAGMEVTAEEVQAEFDKIVDSVGGQEATDVRLEQMGLTTEEFKQTLISDILIQKYLDAEIDEGEIVISDAETQAFYDQIAETGAADLPPYEEVQAQIVEQLKFQKQQSSLVTLVEELREEAEVEILL